MDYFIIALLLVLSYLIGSIPTGYLLVKLVKKTDIRNEGSNSTGATNTTRVLGFKYGLLAFLFDGIKGIIVMSLLVILKLDQYYMIGNFNILGFYGTLGAIGHVFPIFLGFKGGKAVATSLGVICFLTPILGVLAFLIFLVVVFISKYVSLGSIVGTTSALVLVVIFAIFEIPVFKGFATPTYSIIPIGYAISLSLLGIIIVTKHQANIRRIISGTESKIKLKKKNV